MCGIAGLVNYGGINKLADKDIYEQIKSSLKRRGPDQDGINYYDNAALIHARLSVVDIENGRQPMFINKVSGSFALSITASCTTRRKSARSCHSVDISSRDIPTLRCCLTPTRNGGRLAWKS